MHIHAAAGVAARLHASRDPSVKSVARGPYIIASVGNMLAILLTLIFWFTVYISQIAAAMRQWQPKVGLVQTVQQHCLV